MFDATLLVEFKAGLDFKAAVILFERKQAGTKRFDVLTYAGNFMLKKSKDWAKAQLPTLGN